MKKMKRMIMIYAGMLASLVPSCAQQAVAQQTITPYRLEASFDKTTHVIFPSPIVYVDLGSSQIIAGKAGGAENVLRLKAAERDFEAETNLSVITAEGSFYSFNVNYASSPEQLNIAMQNAFPEIYLKNLEGESPGRVSFISRSIHRENKRHIRHIKSRSFGIRYLLKGIHADGNLLYLHTEMRNTSALAFDIDFVRLKIVDKKLAKRTAIQETVIHPLSVWNEVESVEGGRTERTVFAIGKISLPSDKRLVLEVFEKKGGRHQSFTIESADLAGARSMNKLKTEQP
jgi:conjugative transposon TraN protein